MTYQIQFTDSTNPNKLPITVADGTVNAASTSLAFVGKGYPNYASFLSADFLHLLENFAAPTPPNNPVQGQLWYDTSVNILKIYDGTTWGTAGSLKKSGTAPAVANSVAGDLWSNTTTGQLYVFSGSSWLLVGPQFSAGTQTGPNVETIIDSTNITHSVLSMYANGNLIAIISKEKFIPKAAITGFSVINEGINLSSVDSTNTANLTRFWGTAQQADALLINGTTVPSNNFLRSDTISTTNYTLSVRSDSGINIGSNLGFNIGISNNAATLLATSSNTSLHLDLTNSTGQSNTILHVGAPGKVGIGANNIAPSTTLDVSGTVTVRDGVDTFNSPVPGSLVVLGTTDSSYTIGTTFSTQARGSIVAAGGLTVAKLSTFANPITVYGSYNSSGQTYSTPINVNLLDSSSLSPVGGPVLVPGSDAANNLYDIGSSTRSFRNVYAQQFVGNFTGSFSGTLEGSASGTASALASPTVFSLTGDVTSNSISFNGQSTTGTAVFTTKISSDFITAQQLTTDSLLTDEILVYRNGSGLLKVTKQALMSHLALVPIGSIMPFAGATPPSGYLLCDGGEVLISQYPDLFNIIGFTYKSAVYLRGAGTFALPDLRGRFPLGRDSMNNGISVPSSDGSGATISTTTDINGNVSSSAHRVNDVSASSIGLANNSATGYVTLNPSNLPNHTHTLNDGITQYYAVSPPGSPDDPNAIAGYGVTGTSTGFGLPSSGPVNGTTGLSMNIMNPYQTINYIIFTGVI